MKKITLTAALCLSLVGTSLSAQTLQPQMSAQDVTAQMDVERSHVIVPIFAMLLLLLAGHGGNPVPR